MQIHNTLKILSKKAPDVSGVSMNLRGRGWSPKYKVKDAWTLNIYGMRGQISLPEDDRSIPHDEGTICVMPPGTQRRFFTESPGNQWVVHFHPAEFPDCEVFVLNASTQLRNILFLMDSLNGSGDTDRQSVIMWHLLWLLEELCRDTIPHRTGHTLVDRACFFMRRKIAETITIAEVAEYAGCSHNHLTRLFRKHLACSVVGWLRNERLNRARELLENTDLPVKVIGTDVGIADPQLFNKSVRKHFGVSPTQLRG